MAKKKINDYHNFKFHTNFADEWSITDIELDGKPLRGVKYAVVYFTPNNVPIIKLEIIPDNVDIEVHRDIDLPFIEVEDDGKNR